MKTLIEKLRLAVLTTPYQLVKPYGSIEYISKNETGGISISFHRDKPNTVSRLDF